jgi:hypothetical protein
MIGGLTLFKRRGSRRGSRGTRRCPKGQILRKGYTRRYRGTIIRQGYNVHRAGRTIRIRPSLSKVYVPSKCIKDRGLPGKGPAYIKGLKEGELLKHGYTYRLPIEYRHVAIRRAVDEYGPLSVYRKLNAVAKLSVRTAPAASAVFSKDREWVRSHYVLKKE